MSIFGIVLTVNTYITSILSIPPNLLMIYLSTTIGIKEIPEYRFIIIVQAVKDILDSAILSIINMVRNFSIRFNDLFKYWKYALYMHVISSALNVFEFRPKWIVGCAHLFSAFVNVFFSRSSWSWHSTNFILKEQWETVFDTGANRRKYC